MSEQLKELFLRLRQRITPRKILISVLVALIILLPTVLAIFSVVHSNSSKTTVTSRAQTVILYDGDGAELYRENADEGLTGDSSLISIFNTIYDSKREVESIAEKTVTEAPLTAELIWGNRSDTLTCYFSFTEGGSFCTDNAGLYYRIPSEDSERFLSSTYAEILYSASVPPLMSTAEGDTVIPASAEWYYQNIDGLYLRTQMTELANEVHTYDVTSAISIEFADEPDSCSVEIYSDGNRVFLGKPDELIYLILDSDSALRVNVTARWSYLQERAFYGSVNYSFDVIIHNRAEFSVNRQAFSAGEFAVLKATNVSSLSKLNFSSDTDFEPSFTLVDEVAYALIPCPNDSAGGNSFDFTVSYGVSSNFFSIAIEDSSLPDYSDLRQSAAKLGINSSMFGNDTERYPFINGILTLPSDTNFESGYVFGDSLYWSDSNVYSFFNEYICKESYAIPVLSCGGGKVIYTDNTDVMGNVAVIDMGMGLRLWYCNLSTLNVSVGDYVAAGDVIGVTGTLLDGKSEGFSLAMSYYDNILDVNFLFKEKIEL